MAQAASILGSKNLFIGGVVLGLLLIPLGALLGYVVGHQNCNDPCPSGAETAQPIDAGDPAIQSIIADIHRFAKPQDFLDNTTEVNNLLNQVNDLHVKLSPPSGSLSSIQNADKMLPLTQKMLIDLQGILANVKSNHPKALTFATDLFKLKDQLDIFSGAQASSSSNGLNNVPLYKQNFYKDISYPHTDGSSCKGKPCTLASSGCGIMAATMTLNFYNIQVDPPTVAQYSLTNGFRASSGTSYGLFPSLAHKYSLKYQTLTGNWTAIIDNLQQGHPVIVSGKGARPFTSGGHFVVLTGINPDKSINVNDSAGGKDRDNHSYSQDLLVRETHYAGVIYK